jgi:hypothetical protein
MDAAKLAEFDVTILLSPGGAGKVRPPALGF